ncbi:MAG: DUF6056 family protein [Lachnospiraceae bacterium]|nr:DUF6056 family protein [Lachnospiraceae bacterium]
MFKSNRVNISKVSICFLVAVVGVCIYMLNYYTPLYADDYSYSFSFNTGYKIDSLIDIVQSQKIHYQTMNGRVVTHTLAQIFLWLGEERFDIINTIAFLLLGFMMYYHSKGTIKKSDVKVLCFIFMALFLQAPAFGQSFLWTTGASNYLYGILIILFFLIPYRNKLKKREGSLCIVQEIVMCILWFCCGILAGWTNENNSVALICIIIMYMMLYKMEGITYNGWMFSGFLGNIIGCCAMIFSEGELSRLSEVGGNGSIIDCIKRCILFTSDMFDYFGLLMIILSLMLVVVLEQMKFISVKETIKKFDSVIIYFVGFIVSVYSMILAPFFPERTWSGPLVFLVIGICGLYGNINLISLKLKKNIRILLVTMILMTFSTYINAYFDVKIVYTAYQERKVILENSEGLDISLPSILGTTKYCCFIKEGDLQTDFDSWQNVGMAKYYGVKTITGEIR